MQLFVSFLQSFVETVETGDRAQTSFLFICTYHILSALEVVPELMVSYLLVSSLQVLIIGHTQCLALLTQILKSMCIENVDFESLRQAPHIMHCLKCCHEVLKHTLISIFLIQLRLDQHIVELSQCFQIVYEQMCCIVITIWQQHPQLLQHLWSHDLSDDLACVTVSSWSIACLEVKT